MKGKRWGGPRAQSSVLCMPELRANSNAEGAQRSPLICLSAYLKQELVIIMFGSPSHPQLAGQALGSTRRAHLAACMPRFLRFVRRPTPLLLSALKRQHGPAGAQWHRRSKKAGP